MIAQARASRYASAFVRSWGMCPGEIRPESSGDGVRRCSPRAARGWSVCFGRKVDKSSCNRKKIRQLRRIPGISATDFLVAKRVPAAIVGAGTAVPGEGSRKVASHGWGSRGLSSVSATSQQWPGFFQTAAGIRLKLYGRRPTSRTKVRATAAPVARALSRERNQTSKAPGRLWQPKIALPRSSKPAYRPNPIVWTLFVSSIPLHPLIS